MTHKKIVKQLMAMGVQRNDAEAFTRIYHKIVRAGRRDLFPEMEFPVPQVVRTSPVRTLKVAIQRHRYDLYRMGSKGEDVGRYVRNMLAKEMAMYLFDSPFLLYRQRESDSGMIEFQARLQVIDAPWEDKP